MIKVITRPSVFLIGYTELAIGHQDFLEHIGAGSFESDAPDSASEIVEVSGRSCYNSFKYPRPGGNRAYIENILQSAHGSVMEHATYSFAICGISRILSQEITRHRHHSPSQLSQRFVDESESLFVIPTLIELRDDIPDTVELNDRNRLDLAFFPRPKWFDPFNVWADSCRSSLLNYTALVRGLDACVAGIQVRDRTIRRKRVREAARGVLINDIETRMVLSANMRAWRWFLELRGSEDCALELRRLSVAIFRVLQPAAPNLLQDAEVFIDNDGRESLRFAHHKV